MSPEEIIKRPLILTEKGTTMRETQNKYLFEVDPRANKIQIKNAVETLFQVHVRDVNTLINRGKFRRMGRNFFKKPNWKKAMVTLKEGESIDLYEGA